MTDTMYGVTFTGNRALYKDTVEQVEISIPKADSLGMAGYKPIEPIGDQKTLIHALEHPVSGQGLIEIAVQKKAKSACILVSDASRNVPTGVIAPHLIDSLLRAGLHLDKILFIVATGVHRDATEAEMRSIMGEKYAGKITVINHTPSDPENLVYLGDTSFGTPVEVNHRAWQCDLHIAIGKAEPHEFAGYSGGRKSVLPGICSEKTILANHSPTMLYHANARPGILEGNPIHQDMLEAAAMFGLDFTVTMVVTDLMEPAALFCGGHVESHLAAVSYLRTFCQVTLSTRPDIIVTTPGRPLNLDFYQSIKPLIALGGVIDNETVIALYSGCPEGVQSDDMLLPFEQTGSLEEMVNYALNNYRIQMDHSLLVSKILQRCKKILVYSPHVAQDVISAMYMQPCTDPQHLVDTAYSVCGKSSPKVLFYPMPQKGLPTLGPLRAAQ